MFEYFKRRRALKQEMVQRVKEDKAQLKERKEEISALGPEARKVAQHHDKQLIKSEKQQRKDELKSLNRKERRKAKREDKLYRKIKNRPRRFTGWAIVGVLVVFLGVQFGPTVNNLIGMLSGRDITVVSDTPEAKVALEHGDQISEEIANEGIVLLKNEGNHLPLEDKKLNVFGVASLDFRHGGGGSGGSDTSRAVSFYEGLENAGISYNEQLYQEYKEIGEEMGISGDGDVGIIQVIKGMLGKNIVDEPEIDYLSAEMISQAKSHSENALIVISSSATEASDMTNDQLRLSENKRALVEKVAENFENVTIVVNAGNALELGFVEEYDSIKSVLWVGTPGPYGPNAIGRTLTGEINPSGRLTDTYVYDNTTAPGTENFGDYKYDNLKYGFIEYQESIYVGYRFYETYFLDDEAGYQETVLYPYGYGLSYTDFEWNVLDTNFSSEKIDVQVEVTNVGQMAGKDVVQMYYSAPYIAGGLEKSAIELGAYGKTSLLEPGQSEVITLSFLTEDMASYDMHDEEAFVLDAGNYDIKIARNVHDIVETFAYEIDEQVVYHEDSVTGTPFENHFENAHGDITYLSRNDWENTYPSHEKVSYEAPQYIVDLFDKELEDSQLDMPSYGVENGLVLEDLKGVDFDDPLWDEFLDQFTQDEMIEFVTNGAYKTIGIDRLGIPQTLLMDGPAGFSYFFTQVVAAAYPTEVVLASTWNDDLAYQMGKAVGKEAKAYGIQGWYAPGMNIHRTAQGGRNFEYFSEDPLLSGKISAAMTKGAQDQGIIVFMKHFALNDQETNARSGVVLWADEQAIREIYLKPFEITVKEADVLGVMSSFSMIGGKWAGANSALLNDVLRDEWGFDGFVTSDAVFGFMKAPDAVVAGNDLMLDIMTPKSQEKLLKKAYKQDPSGIANGLRTSVHHILYTILKTYLFE